MGYVVPLKEVLVKRDFGDWKGCLDVPTLIPIPTSRGFDMRTT